jgi:hypothetical protein
MKLRVRIRIPIHIAGSTCIIFPILALFSDPDMIYTAPLIFPAPRGAIYSPTLHLAALPFTSFGLAWIGFSIRGYDYFVIYVMRSCDENVHMAIIISCMTAQCDPSPIVNTLLTFMCVNTTAVQIN